MQEEVNEKTIALVVRSSRMTAEILKNALARLLRTMEAEQRERRMARQIEKRTETEKTGKGPAAKRVGKKSLAAMVKEGKELSNIEITDSNIRSFEKVAAKYHVQYSLKKDKSVTPPRYLVFFRAKDVDLMTAAFREYTGLSIRKTRKPSVRKKLQQAMKHTAEQKHRELEKVKARDRGPQR